MLEELRKTQADLDALKKSLPKSKTQQVSSVKIKESTRLMVDSYFRVTRVALINNGLEEGAPIILDNAMQELLQFTHGRIKTSKYLQAIKSARASSVLLEQACLKNVSQPILKQASITNTDQLIIDTLKAILPSAAISYEQALIDLRGKERLSWRGPATDLREALRETLDHLAPDKEVEKQEGYKKEADTKGPTMKQKTRYILLSRNLGKSTSATTEDAVSTVEELLGSFVRSIYVRSSVSTHTPTDKNEVLRIRDLVRIALCELLAISNAQ